MVVKLRKTLNEKLEKSASLNLSSKQLEVKKKENEDASNKAVSMVVINTLIGLLFKLPLCILPLINIHAHYIDIIFYHSVRVLAECRKENHV